MSVLTRTKKGSPLTHLEQDGNLSYLAQRTQLQVLQNPLVVGKFGHYNRGFSDGSQLSKTFFFKFDMLLDCTGVQFHYGNWVLGNTDGGNSTALTGLNPITIRQNLVFHGRPTFNGQDSLTLAMGASAPSDPHPTFFKAGVQNAMWINVSVAQLGQKWPQGYRLNTSLPEGHANGDTTGSFDQGAQEPVLAYTPYAITGIPLGQRTRKIVALNGDSVMSTPFEGTEQQESWAVRGMNAAGIPWMRSSVGGAKMSDFYPENSGSGMYGLLNMTGAEITLAAFGSNDLFVLADFATAQAAYLRYWYALRNTGTEVVAATIPPRNDFPTDKKALRVQLNDWIRTTPAPLSGYVDLADILETARNSGVWKPGYSDDGTHPTATGHAAAAAAIVPAQFAL